jgi:hypothetical protein
MMVALTSWVLREWLAPVLVSVIWLLVTAPLLLGYLSAPLQLAEATHMKYKKVQRKRSQLSGSTLIKPHRQKRSTLEDLFERGTASTAYYTDLVAGMIVNLLGQAGLHVWNTLQDSVFGMRTRHTKRRSGKLARARCSSTYYIGVSCKRSSRVGRKHRSAHHQWTRLLLFLATLPTGPPDAAATFSGLARSISPPIQHRYAAFDSDSVTLRVNNCCTASITNSLQYVVGAAPHTHQGLYRRLHRRRGTCHCQVYCKVACGG